ncbi:MAG TPA: hypothetical protein DCF44_01165, partial [Chitinophagaceae bacterium]|nr:hypothetical protein [Chitinophagaceae bacterium]
NFFRSTCSSISIRHCDLPGYRDNHQSGVFGCGWQTENVVRGDAYGVRIEIRNSHDAKGSFLRGKVRVIQDSKLDSRLKKGLFEIFFIRFQNKSRG